MLKKITIGLGLLVVIFAVGIYYFSQNAGKYVQAAIESQGSRATQVAVTLDNVDINFSDLKASLIGLKLANPKGFHTDQAMSLGEISVKIGEDWSPKRIVIEEVMVRAPKITYEIGSDGSNIAAIQENVENFMKVMGAGGDSNSAAVAEPSSSDASGEEGPKVIINHLYIKGGEVNVSATLFKGKTLTSPLPDIHLTDIGKESGGASPAEVVEEIIAAITASSNSAASGLDLSSLGLGDITGKAADLAKSATDILGSGSGASADAAKKAVEGAQDVLGGAADGATKVLGGAGDALKGLLGN